jgi:hypothetical protein
LSVVPAKAAGAPRPIRGGAHDELLAAALKLGIVELDFVVQQI